ncbi:MAG: DegV family protein [Spirochaetales bacterium]|nr:DegV family protein [Spirochaetales bacterium]
MKISYIDGPRLVRALEYGARSLIEHASQLNDINVFPVPDGDTGTNMANTVRSMSLALAVPEPGSAGLVLQKAARAALSAARGNSGAILAQFFWGLAEELGHEARIGAKKLAAAAVKAAERTRKALSIPKDGTILTVLHDWAHAMYERAQHCDDIFEVFAVAFESAKASLERTKEALPEMRRAGVVDAGAKGFVHLLEGIAHFMRAGSLREALQRRKRHAIPSEQSILSVEEHEFPDDQLDVPLPFRYCTEAMLSGEALDPDAIRQSLTSLGDSLVVAGSGQLVRIHIHTNQPSRVFDVLDAVATVDAHKVDDMELQRRLQQRSKTAHAPTVAIVVDTGCDLPEDFLLEHGIVKVPALITIDGKTRPDGPSLDTEAIYGFMRTRSDFAVSTSQPPEAAFSRAFGIAASSHVREILYIGLSSALSGTFRAGQRAAAQSTVPVTCFDSRSLTAAASVLTRAAVHMAEQGMGASEIAASLAHLRDRMFFLVGVRNLTSLIRSGRLHGLKSVILRKFGLRPLLTTDAEGKAATAGIFAGEGAMVQALFAKLRKHYPAGSIVEVHITHVDAPEDAAKLASLCSEHFHPDSRIEVSPMGALLASLGWLGAIGIACVSR